MKLVHFIFTLFIACTLSMLSPSICLAEGPNQDKAATEEPSQKEHTVNYPNLNERDGYDSKTDRERYRRTKTKSQKKALRKAGLRHNL